MQAEEIMLRTLCLTVIFLIPTLAMAQANFASGDLQGEAFVDFQFENLDGKKVDSDILNKLQQFKPDVIYTIFGDYRLMCLIKE